MSKVGLPSLLPLISSPRRRMEHLRRVPASDTRTLLASPTADYQTPEYQIYQGNLLWNEVEALRKEVYPLRNQVRLIEESALENNFDIDIDDPERNYLIKAEELNETIKAQQMKINQLREMFSEDEEYILNGYLLTQRQSLQQLEKDHKDLEDEVASQRSELNDAMTAPEVVLCDRNSKKIEELRELLNEMKQEESDLMEQHSSMLYSAPSSSETNREIQFWQRKLQNAQHLAAKRRVELTKLSKLQKAQVENMEILIIEKQKRDEEVHARNLWKINYQLRMEEARLNRQREEEEQAEAERQWREEEMLRLYQIEEDEKAEEDKKAQEESERRQRHKHRHRHRSRKNKNQEQSETAPDAQEKIAEAVDAEGQNEEIVEETRAIVEPPVNENEEENAPEKNDEVIIIDDAVNVKDILGQITGKFSSTEGTTDENREKVAQESVHEPEEKVITEEKEDNQEDNRDTKEQNVMTELVKEGKEIPTEQTEDEPVKEDSNEATEEKQKEPVDESAKEADDEQPAEDTNEAIEEKQEAPLNEEANEVAEETQEEPVEEKQEEPANEDAKDVTEEKQEESAKEDANEQPEEEKREESAKEAIEEKQEEPAEEKQEEPAKEDTNEATEEKQEESANEEEKEKTEEKKQEEPVKEDANEQPAEEKQEDGAKEEEKDVTEEKQEEPAKEDANEQPAEEKQEAQEETKVLLGEDTLTNNLQLTLNMICGAATKPENDTDNLIQFDDIPKVGIVERPT